MIVVAISDTHGLHDLCKLPQGDMLIHAGDVTEYGSEEEIIDFLKWFAKQPFPYKIFIAGNHDLYLEQISLPRLRKMIPRNVIYLQNSGVEVNGSKNLGLPGYSLVFRNGI